MTTNMSIKLLITGGTIDKSYNESNGELGFVESHISNILKKGRNLVDVEFQQLMLKDSLDMNDGDRQLIAKTCKDSSQDKILISHGTDTMVDTAMALSKSKLDKTIVLVGAMVPFVFKHSDAEFNIGFALAAVQSLPAGVYVAMNGSIFNANSVTKNKNKGVFEPLS